jgi:hypothetical protein
VAALHELARLIRSKNAGPFELTIDIMFDNKGTFEAVVASGRLNEEVCSALYGVDAELVRVIPYPAANSIKITIPRTVSAGTVGDVDVAGGQQYAPLVDIEIPTVAT